jgi:hypothetical protein
VFSIMLIAAICTLPALHWATEVGPKRRIAAAQNSVAVGGIADIVRRMAPTEGVAHDPLRSNRDGALCSAVGSSAA